MATNDIHQDIHDEFLHMRDHNGIPLYIHAINYNYYSKREYELYLDTIGCKLKDGCECIECSPRDEKNLTTNNPITNNEINNSAIGKKFRELGIQDLMNDYEDMYGYDEI